jgi:hypothetical protein
VNIEQVIDELNTFFTGWVTYFRHAECRGLLCGMDKWVRRKLRCLRLRQCRFMSLIASWLMKLGVPKRRAWLLAQSGKGWWRLSGSPGANEGMSAAWFRATGSGELGHKARAVERLEETAGYDEYVRWCGRTGAERPPPTRFHGQLRSMASRPLPPIPP